MNGIQRILVNFALRLIKSQVIDKINYPPAQGFTTIAFENLQRSIEIVIDNDKNNDAQFKALWAAHKVEILGQAIETTKLIVVAEVDNNTTENLIVSLLDEIKAELDAGGILKLAA